mgnify:FL=1
MTATKRPQDWKRDHRLLATEDQEVVECLACADGRRVKTLDVRKSAAGGIEYLIDHGEADILWVDQSVVDPRYTGPKVDGHSPEELA